MHRKELSVTMFSSLKKIIENKKIIITLLGIFWGAFLFALGWNIADSGGSIIGISIAYFIAFYFFSWPVNYFLVQGVRIFVLGFFICITLLDSNYNFFTFIIFTFFVFVILLLAGTPKPPPDKPHELNSAKDAGNLGESLMRENLKTMIGSSIDGYISSNNMLLDNKNFEIDFLVLVPDFGLVLTEVKHYSGEIHCTSNDQWKQIQKGEIKYVKNGSKQVLRTQSLLIRTLENEKVKKWDIKSVVVFTNQNSKIVYGWNEEEPQTDVIEINQIDDWILGLPKPNNFEFLKSDYDQLKKIIRSYEKEYIPDYDL